MPQPMIETDELLEKAQKLKTDALEILKKEDATAEDLQTAENMITEAENLASKSKKLVDLKKRADEIKSIPDHSEFGEADDTSKKQWSSFGHYLIAVKKAIKGQGVDPRLQYFESEMSTIEKKDLSESVGTAGGYLVPAEFRPELLAKIEELAVVRARALVIPMARRTLEVPALDQDDTTAGVPHWFGGMIAFWESEAATIQETEPKFRTLTLTAHELNAVTHVSNNLLQDSAISLATLLTGPRGFPGVIAWKEDYAFLRGSGVGEPLGVLEAPATIGVARTTASTIKYDDLVNMLNSQLPSANAIWIANMKTKATLLLMNGPAGNPLYLWGNAREGIPDTLLGMPIIFTEKLPVLGTRGDIMLCDFSHYYVGDRRATTIDSTDQERWLRNQTSWKVTHRVDGQPWLNAPFTLSDGAQTISPFVRLNT